MMDAIWWLAQPSHILALAVLLAALLGGLGWRTGASGLAGFVAVALAAVAVLPIHAWIATPLESRAAVPDPLPEAVDGILVLGGAVEWRVAAARDQLALDAAGERVLAGAALARRYPGAQLAFTGLYADALPHDLGTEPDARSLLWGPEFDGARFLGEARSTYEDALVALERLDPGPNETWLLVTSALHMPRAVGVFATLGWSVVPYPVDYRTDGAYRWGLRGDVAAELAAIDRAVRDWGASRRNGRSRSTNDPGGSCADRVDAASTPRRRRAPSAPTGAGSSIDVPSPGDGRRARQRRPTPSSQPCKAPRSISASAICTALSAAPLRI